jgi:hypothetical protein
MMGSLFVSSSEVFQISKNDASKIMKNAGHGPLKRSTNIFESKRHDAIRKGTPRVCKSSFVLIYWVDLNLIIARELIHKGQCLMANKIIDDLVDGRGWEFVFGTSMVEVVEVSVDANSSLFFVKKDEVGDPRSVRNGVNELDNA